MGILELHLHEPEFNVAPRTGRRSSTESLKHEASEMMDESDGGGGGSMGAILALALLVGAAIAIRRLRKGGGEGTSHGDRGELAEIGK